MASWFLYTLFNAESSPLRRRGPRPLINDLDSMCLILTWLKHGITFAAPGKIFDYSEHVVQKAVERVWPALYAALAKKWWEKRRRPRSIDSVRFPHIGLVGDSTSIEVFRPKGRFEEAKTYWDGKNEIYGVKKEVMVMAHPPHYALFSQDHEVGSTHDYCIFKKNFEDYVGYLCKRPDEVDLIPNDVQNASWSVLLDSGYLGEERDFPLLRRVVIPRHSTATGRQKEDHAELSGIRSCVEIFFGRMHQNFAMIRNVHRWNHEHFDMDFDLCVLLTNELILTTNLEQEDANFLLKSLECKKQAHEERMGKRKASAQRSQSNRNMRARNADNILSLLGPVIPGTTSTTRSLLPNTE